MIRKRRLSPISAARRKRMAAYGIKVSKWKRANPLCKVCFTRGRKVAKTQDCHHRRGRVGQLLFEEKYWLPVCRPCHIHIHAHCGWAKNYGFIEKWGQLE